jgi:hypothetical protein
MMDKRLVKLVWHDASDPDRDSGPWYSDRDLDEFGDEVVAVTSVGWLRSQTDKYVTLAGDYFVDADGDITWGRPTKVPTKMVVSMVDIGEVSVATDGPKAS